MANDFNLLDMTCPAGFCQLSPSVAAWHWHRRCSAKINFQDRMRIVVERRAQKGAHAHGLWSPVFPLKSSHITVRCSWSQPMMAWKHFSTTSDNPDIASVPTYYDSHMQVLPDSCQAQIIARSLIITHRPNLFVGECVVTWKRVCSYRKIQNKISPSPFQTSSGASVTTSIQQKFTSDWYLLCFSLKILHRENSKWLKMVPTACDPHHLCSRRRGRWFKHS